MHGKDYRTIFKSDRQKFEEKLANKKKFKKRLMALRNKSF